MRQALLTLLALGTATLARTPAPAQSPTSPASLKAQAPEKFKAKFTTTKGDFVIEVTRAWAPRGADRFYNLVKNGFNNDCSFFRYVPGFIVQFGIPADPKITQAWQSANIQDQPTKNCN